MDLCPKCRTVQPENSLKCVHCGLDFAMRHPPEGPEFPKKTGDAPVPHSDRDGLAAFLKETLLEVPPEEDRWALGGRAAVYAVLLVWGIRFLFTPIESNYWTENFMHAVNLPFHEAGHILFAIFGIGLPGGSLMQLLMPLICMAAFLKHRNLFGSSVALWWLGQNFMNLSPYINDARSMTLMLLGGVTGQDDFHFHDWHRILGNLGWLQYDHAIARLSYVTGALLMIASFLWGGYILRKQWTLPQSPAV